jgi:2-isopropylmalate synthase
MGLETLRPEKLHMLTETSRYVFEVGNLLPAANLPYVGDSAFAHKAGLHIDALRKSKRTYEHIDPTLVGNERRFLISELSGKSNILAELEKAKLTQDKKVAKKILERVQELENEGYQFEAAEASFALLVRRLAQRERSFFDLDHYAVSIVKDAQRTPVTEATVKLRVGQAWQHTVAEGDGPVNALDGALRKALLAAYPNLAEMVLVDYKVRVINSGAGTAAKVRVVIESRDREEHWGTVGVSENIIDASWQALVDSIAYKLSKPACPKSGPVPGR